MSSGQAEPAVCVSTRVEPDAGDGPVAEHWQGPLGEGLVYSRRAPGWAEANEDRAGCWQLGQDALVLAVADGAGGHATGGQAADLALDGMAEALAELGAGEGGAAAALLAGFDRANRRVMSLRTGAATTLAAVLVEGRMVRTFHSGDSQALVTGQRGKIRLLTTAHSPVGYAVEAGVLDQREAIHHDERHLVSNLVGAPDMHIEVSAPVRLQTRDTVVVASDGLFDNLQVGEVVEFARIGPLTAAAERLAARCRQRMEEPGESEPSKVDDVTFILYRLAGAAAGAAAERSI
ncbi:MAG: protein phosphatase 2C domain-containing protein [Deltaproteobacteria bacterium]|nr:protein phosphatase 2C domain-containing protein [Deltaproteobacteria bacterium]MBW2534798.1 protein phosphatase 2C domain-containing protein [Deltaproteobacteria bacterium]